MEKRLEACSHYCDNKRGKLYVPNSQGGGTVAVGGFKNKVKRHLKPGSPLFKVLKKVYSLYSISKVNRTFYPNNHLGIFVTTACNLGCCNCQTSARQAPSKDFMSLEQIDSIVNEAIDLRYYWNVIRITGGEATMHPKFFEFLDILKRYNDFNPDAVFILETNGVGTKVQSRLEKLPDWVSVYNSAKKQDVTGYEFASYMVAPKDLFAYKFADYSKGCSRISSCYGVSATMFGYYPCAPCMNVARVFGLDVGIKKLSDITEDSLRAQMKVLCKNCGWFKKRAHQEILSTDKMSPAWEKALSDYKKNKPQLTPYEVVRPSRKENEEAVV